MKMYGNPDWFSGNEHGYMFFQLLIELAHIWDDLIDKDVERSDDDINHAFLICLVLLPSNPVYKALQEQLLPMWVQIITAYQTANEFEKNKDEHGLEISHTLRYAAGHMIGYVMIYCSGLEKARKYMPDMWKLVVGERFDEYRKEHLNVQN